MRCFQRKKCAVAQKMFKTLLENTGDDCHRFHRRTNTTNLSYKDTTGSRMFFTSTLKVKIVVNSSILIIIIIIIIKVIIF